MKNITKSKLNLLFTLIFATIFSLGLGIMSLNQKEVNVAEAAARPTASWVYSDSGNSTFKHSEFNQYFENSAEGLNFAGGSGTKEDPYHIATAKDLAYLAYRTRYSGTVSGQSRPATNFAGLYFKLTSNINLEGDKLRWTPIGTTATGRRFAGSLDGNGFTISNLNANETSTSFTYLGLFGAIEGGEFKNIKITDANVQTAAYSAAIFAAYANNVKVDGVEVSGEVNSTSYYAGGVFGEVYNTAKNSENTIKNVKNEANVKGTYNLGGVVARLSDVSMSNITNNGNVNSTYSSSSSSNRVGGIIGIIAGNSPIELDNLTNNGDIGDQTSATINYAGGLIGESVSVGVSVKLTNSTNNQKVDARGNYVGGIAGQINYVEAINVVNNANVIGNIAVGGLFGRAVAAKITDSENNGLVEAKRYNVGGLIGYALSTTEITNSNNYANVFAQHELKDDVYTPAYDQNTGSGGLVGVWSGLNSFIKNSVNSTPENPNIIVGTTVGGAIGYVNGSNILIENFNSYGTFWGSTSTSSNANRGSGGIIGFSGNAGSVIEIRNANNRAKVIGCHVGGAIGNLTATSTVDIKNFVNYADFQSDAKLFALGGIIGYSNARVNFDNVINLGDISHTSNYAGGLVGRMLNINSFIKNSKNFGNVSASGYVGGIIGEGRGNLENVKNLGSVNGTSSYVGGVAGYTYGLTLKNVYNSLEGEKIFEFEGTEQAHEIKSAGSYVGGFIGSINTGSIVTIQNSINRTNVFGASYVGGIIGRSYQTVTLNTVENHGNVKSSENSGSGMTGGFIGIQASGVVTITNCLNAGNVEGLKIANSVNNYSYATGGFVGAITASGASIKITDSQNSGKVTGEFAGGIIGYNQITSIMSTQLIRVVNTGDVLSESGKDGRDYYGYAAGFIATSASNSGSAYIKDSYNSGNVTGRYVGGLVGYVYNIEIESSTNYGNLVTNTHLYEGATWRAGLGGLVYYSLNQAKISNVTLTKDVIYLSGNALDYFGGFVARGKNISIYNSHIEIEFLTNYDAVSVSTYFGGMIGNSNNATTLEIINSSISGKLSSDANYFGGMIAVATNTIGKTLNVNGITTIKNSYSSLDLISYRRNTRQSFIGGLVGYTRGGLLIEKSAVIGDIEIDKTHSNSNFTYWIGGFVGYQSVEYNTVENLTKLIKDSYFIGEIKVQSAQTVNQNTHVYAGGMVGGVVYVSPKLSTEQELNFEIKNSYFYGSLADINVAISKFAGLIARINFTNTTAGAEKNIVFNNVFYLGNTIKPIHSADYANGGSIKYNQDIKQIDDLFANLTAEEFKKPETFANFDFAGQGSNVYWAISTQFNSNLPYLTNLFNAKIVFNVDDDEHKTVKTLVGKQITLTETLVPRPSKPFSQFAGWKTFNGERTYIYGDLIDIQSEQLDLYAVWQDQEYYIDIVDNRGNLVDSEGAILTYKYITIGTTNKLAIPTLKDGEEFVKWEVYNPETNNFDEFSLDGTVELSSKINQSFLQQYSFIDENGRVALKFQLITAGTTRMVSVEFDANSTDLGRVLLNDESYVLGTNIYISQDTTFTLDILPRNYYKVSQIVVLDQTSKEIEGELYSITPEGKYVFTLPFEKADRFKVVISFEKIAYELSIKTKLNTPTGEEIKDVELVSVAGVGQGAGLEGLTLVIGDTIKTISPIDVEGYRFVGFQIFNGNNFASYANGAIATETFLNSFLHDNKVEIVAVFAIQKQLKITTNIQEGSFKAYISQPNGEKVQILNATSGVFIDAGTTIIIEAYPEPSYTFVKFEEIETEFVNGTIANFVLNDDKDITLDFEKYYYTISAHSIDDENNLITGIKDEDVLVENNIDILVEGNRPLNEITVGMRIVKIAFKKSTLPGPRYVFDGWYFMVNGQLVKLSTIAPETITEDNQISELIIDQNIVDNYVSNISDLILVARYKRIFAVEVLTSHQERGTYKLYTVEDGKETEVTDGTRNFTVGTVIKIVPNVSNSNYYEFENFAGISDYDNVKSDSVTFVLNSDRTITLNYLAKEFDIVVDAQTQNAKGSLTHTQGKFAVGDTIVLTFNAQSGYEVRQWIIYDKTGKAYSADSEELKNNITYKNNTLAIKIDEWWVENFGLELDNEVKTMMNSTYLTVLTAGGIAIPVLLVGIILLIFMSNKKKAQLKLEQERAAQAQARIAQTEIIQNLIKETKDQKDKQWLF